MKKTVASPERSSVKILKCLRRSTICWFLRGDLLGWAMIRFTTSPGISPVFRISSADVYRKYQAEEDIDVSEEVDCGQEWPDCENTDVARYREFYQVGGSVLDKLSNTPVCLRITASCPPS